MDGKYFSGERSFNIAPQSFTILQERNIPISQNKILQNINSSTMHSNYKRQEDCLLTDLQKYPSWPAPSFRALLSMDYSQVIRAELVSERDPTATPQMPRMQSLYTNNLPPLQPPTFQARPTTGQQIPPTHTNHHSSLLRSSLNSSLRLAIIDPYRRKFRCSKCQATFYNAQAYGGHMSYHTKEKRKEQQERRGFSI